jgi:hypothetical protein
VVRRSPSFSLRRPMTLDVPHFRKRALHWTLRRPLHCPFVGSYPRLRFARGAAVGSSFGSTRRPRADDSVTQGAHFGHQGADEDGRRPFRCPPVGADVTGDRPQPLCARVFGMPVCDVCKMPVVVAPLQLPDGSLIHPACMVEHLQRSTPAQPPGKRRSKVGPLPAKK